MNDDELAALATIGQRMVNAADTIVRQRDLIDELRKQNGERANLITELRQLHLAAKPRGNMPGDACAGCGEIWPCDTATILDRYDTEAGQ